MKNELYKQMYNEYQKGFSLSEVGKMFGMTRQSVFSGFKCRKYKMRSKPQLPYQFFDGKKFTLRNHGYYSLTIGKRDLMHRYVWEYHKGKIKKNYDIHHIDHNKANNNINNLELYSKAEHASKFATGNNQYGKGNRQT